MNNDLISFGSRTDCGQIRPHNEDSLVVYPPLFAVADGMGGHEAGEIASEIAIETLVAQAPKSLDAKTLGRAVMAANRAVLRASKDGVGKPGMGTTMTAAMIDDDKLIIAQVGDSRAYLLHQGQLQRITRDHSLMADYIETGQITEEESRWHPQRSVITRALGSDPDMVPDLFELNVEPGDRLLLCSDGLSGMVYDEGIRDILDSIPDPQLAADALINAATDFGGHDNITAIVVNVGRTTPEKERVRSHRSKRTIALFILAFV
ncbi:MAG: Stp1/IreP family PP2C-type Ser/Thr phosphatase, partial [Actinobacteria bacterium]|nr:Stp1/IreP family PP2C-type Ser/Thr phosphatase [Actinomycetota bacterium]